MPYIKQEERPQFDNILDQISVPSASDLKRGVTKLMDIFMSTREQRYSTLHDCVYAAHHCSEEFERRFNFETVFSTKINKKETIDFLSEIKKIDTKGQLEYCIFKLMRICASQCAKMGLEEIKTISYGVLVCSLLYRVEYLDAREDKAIEENGDVF